MTSSVAGRDLRRPLLGLSVVPFQLAYTVSIHKAQGLEYNSAKEVIPSSNSEQISHGIFYTAITRAKELLIIVGREDTIVSMTENAKKNRRYSGLKLRLQGKVQ